MQPRSRIVLVALLVAAFFTLLSSHAHGVWHRAQVTTTAESSTSPRIVHDTHDVVHIFWEESGEIRHQAFGTNQFEVVGAGRTFDLSACPVCGVISLSWIGPDDTAWFRSWRDGVWGEVAVMPRYFDGAVRGVAVSHHGDGRLLWAEEDAALQEIVFLFAWQSDGDWDGPVELGRIGTVPWYPESVALALRRTGEDGRMIASWLESEVAPQPGLVVRTGKERDWTPPTRVCDWFAGAYAMGSCYPMGTVHVASNGPQPTCPCNSLLYVAGAEDSWSEPENIGRDHYPAEMEWPREMSVHVRDADDVPFVVWRHEAYEMLVPVDERLILGRRESGSWNYDYGLAVDRNAHDPDVSTSASGDVWVVWSDDSDGSVNLHVATTEYLADAPATGPSSGDELSIYPNPSRSGSFVEWSRRGFGSPLLRIFDARGRQVASLGLGTESGPVPESGADFGRDRVWWELTDRAGRPLPTGVYLLELSDDVRREESRLIVIR